MSQHTDLNLRSLDRVNPAESVGNSPDTGWSRAAADAYPPRGSGDRTDKGGGAIEAFGEMFSFSSNSGFHASSDVTPARKGDQDLNAVIFTPEGQKMLYSKNNTQGAKSADALIQRVLDS